MKFTIQYNFRSSLSSRVLFVKWVILNCILLFQGYPPLQNYMGPGYYQQYAAAYSNPQAAATGNIKIFYHQRL